MGQEECTLHCVWLDDDDGSISNITPEHVCNCVFVRGLVVQTLT